MKRETLPAVTDEQNAALSQISEADIADARGWVERLGGVIRVQGQRLTGAFLRRLWEAEDGK